jgi:hypothetical protein
MSENFTELRRARIGDIRHIGTISLQLVLDSRGGCTGCVAEEDNEFCAVLPKCRDSGVWKLANRRDPHPVSPDDGVPRLP